MYALDDAGCFVFAGARPVGDESGRWHGHGYTLCRPWMLRGGRLVRVTVAKHRWRHVARGDTVTSQPPDLLPRRRVDLLVVATALLRALTAPVGLHSRGPDAPGARSLRQLQRDLAAACELAEPTQRAVRLALMHRCVPRPVESLWEAGLDPPPELARRCRHSSAPLIWRALEMLRTGAEQLGTPTISLLAEARGRWTGPDSRFLV
ncbi:hypothetical protein H8E07_14540 [bacterium]|nr:hypothetical protein [bacterium]